MMAIFKPRGKNMTKVLTKKTPVASFPAILCIENIAKEIISSIPLTLQEKVKKINIAVENYASKDILKSLSIEDKYELLGLYRGTPMQIKSIFHDSNLEDNIFLYRCPLIRYSYENNQCVTLLVKQVLMHELGHHFGNMNLLKNVEDIN